jgi:epoxyqueuosine reductase
MMKEKLLQSLEKYGYLGRVVPAHHLHDLQEHIRANYKRGILDEEFYQECLADQFVFSLPESLPEVRSLIVAAVRQPQIRFTFTWKDKQIPLIVPPTYLHWQETNRQVEKVLIQLLEPQGYQLVKAVVPRKLLAVQSGLAEYGRNNITYVAGMGSFHRLVTFYSDLPCEEDNWREPEMMERCQRCSACVRDCPSGAITTERVLLRAERCIVLHNERPSEVLFPEWLEAGWHNCLVGCMLCQRICPENQNYLDWIEEGATFSSEETALLLAGMPLEQLPDEVVKKLEASDLVALLDILPRNLKVLFEGAG